MKTLIVLLVLLVFFHLVGGFLAWGIRFGQLRGGTDLERGGSNLEYSYDLKFAIGESFVCGWVAVVLDLTEYGWPEKGLRWW